MMDITDKESYRSLYSELKQYEKRGIDILMDGYQVSPMQIVTAYMAKEEGAYMRDYVMEKIKSPCITLEIGVAGCPLPISQFSSIWRKNESLVLREAKLLL